MGAKNSDRGGIRNSDLRRTPPKHYQLGLVIAYLTVPFVWATDIISELQLFKSRKNQEIKRKKLWSIIERMFWNKTIKPKFCIKKTRVKINCFKHSSRAIKTHNSENLLLFFSYILELRWRTGKKQYKIQNKIIKNIKNQFLSCYKSKYCTLWQA